MFSVHMLKNFVHVQRYEGIFICLVVARSNALVDRLVRNDVGRRMVAARRSDMFDVQVIGKCPWYPQPLLRCHSVL